LFAHTRAFRTARTTARTAHVALHTYHIRTAALPHTRCCRSNTVPCPTFSILVPHYTAHVSSYRYCRHSLNAILFTPRALRCVACLRPHCRIPPRCLVACAWLFTLLHYNFGALRLRAYLTLPLPVRYALLPPCRAAILLNPLAFDAPHALLDLGLFACLVAPLTCPPGCLFPWFVLPTCTARLRLDSHAPPTRSLTFNTTMPVPSA